jgi:hypothetical protein
MCLVVLFTLCGLSTVYHQGLWISTAHIICVFEWDVGNVSGPVVHHPNKLRPIILLRWWCWCSSYGGCNSQFHVVLLPHTLLQLVVDKACHFFTFEKTYTCICRLPKRTAVSFLPHTTSVSCCCLLLLFVHLLQGCVCACCRQSCSDLLLLAVYT